MPWTQEQRGRKEEVLTVLITDLHQLRMASVPESSPKAYWPRCEQSSPLIAFSWHGCGGALRLRCSGSMPTLVCSASSLGHWAPEHHSICPHPYWSVIITWHVQTLAQQSSAEIFLCICVGLSFPQHSSFYFLTFTGALVSCSVWCVKSVKSVSLPNRERLLRSHHLGLEVSTSAFSPRSVWYPVWWKLAAPSGPCHSTLEALRGEQASMSPWLTPTHASASLWSSWEWPCSLVSTRLNSSWSKYHLSCDSLLFRQTSVGTWSSFF
jgi:hypothetical protein